MNTITLTGKEVVVGLSGFCVKGDSCLCTLMVLNVTTSVTSVCGFDWAWIMNLDLLSFQQAGAI